MIHSQVVITEYDNKICSFLLNDNLLEDLHVSENTSSLHNIYIGKVKNISKNINAAFVEIANGQKTFLPLETVCKDIKEGDELLVQVIKDGVKTKDAVISTDLSLHGVYSVVSLKNGLAPIQFSKKLEGNEKKQLADALKDISSPYGIIIRTNAKHAKDTESIISEINNLTKQMNTILLKGKTRTCFSCIYENEPEYVEYVTKLPKDSYEEIVTDSYAVYETLKKYNFPVRFYEDSYSLKKLFSLDHKLQELLNKMVYLKSGATLFIEPTEALTVIDVNTGKCVLSKNKDELILKINLEAAEEIIKQLRLRNISGIIIIDFINMKKKEHIEQLIATMKQLVKQDRVPCSYVDVTPLGLMELTRKKVQKPLNELFARKNP